MEPAVGDLYMKDRAAFEDIARSWTWRYAMHDAVSPIWSHEQYIDLFYDRKVFGRNKCSFLVCIPYHCYYHLRFIPDGP